MPIPVSIPTEDGRKAATPHWFRTRFAEGRHPDDARLGGSEMAGLLGVVGHGWMELLMQGFPSPCTVAEAKAWFAANGWLDD